MKHLHFIASLFLFLSVISFTSCDEDGDLALPSVQLVSEPDFTSLVEGKAWKYVESHEIKDNGTMCKADYWDGLVGSAPVQYGFSGGALTTYMYIDAYPIHCYKAAKYTFEEGTNRVVSGSTDVFTVVSVSQDRLCIIRRQATRADGNDVYVYAVYRAMTAYEQAELKQDYPYNLDTMDEDYPQLPEQETVTETNFAALAVGKAWRCAEAHALVFANRYSKDGFFTDGTQLKPVDYEITADTVYEITQGEDPSAPVRKGYAYTFNANGRYVETQGGTTFHILRLTDDEMHLVQERADPASGKAVRLYCIYRRAGLFG